MANPKTTSPKTIAANEAHKARLEAYAAELMATGKYKSVTVDKRGNVIRQLKEAKKAQ